MAPQSSLGLILLLTVYLFSSGTSASVEQTKEDTKEEFNDLFSDPSAKAAVFKHIDDMTFIEAPHRQGEERARRNAIIHPGALWPNARVPYVISSDFSELKRDLILRAMRHWEDNTCIRFLPRTIEIYYIYIISGDGCSSYVGRLSRYSQPQGVSLGPGCVHFRTAVHELGHAIGFYHEHTRPDRDQYISVITNNIRSGQAGNFRKDRPGATNTLGYGYDYASIMHYHSNSFAKSYTNPTIVANDEGVVFGSAQELSPLDILKANKLYGCVNGSHPPISTHPQNAQSLSLPDGITCGGVIEGKSGTLYSPGYPDHVTNLSCVWVIRVPDGYYIELRFPNLNLEQSTDCSKDYAQVFHGNSVDSGDGVHLSSSAQDGKFCSSSQVYSQNYVFETTATVHYHTDGSNSVSTHRGLKVDFTAIEINECSRSRCHRCTNLPGSYRCECDDGYYHSPAANTCYDVNECAYDNGGCEHVCDNTGGSYRCLCDSGYYLQSDGLSCSLTPPAPPTTAPPTTMPPPTTVPPPAPPTTAPPTTMPPPTTVPPPAPPTTAPPTTMPPPTTVPPPAPPTTAPPTTMPPPTTVPPPAPPTTAPPTTMPPPTTVPPPAPPTTRPTTVPTTRPTTVPTTTPTTLPTTQPTTDPTLLPTSSVICGPSLFTELSGSFQTPSWPETYPFNFDCVWTLSLPVPGCEIELTFDSTAFGIAGRATQDCPKDYLKIYNNAGQLLHTLCDLERPSLYFVNNNANLHFHSGPFHGSRRKGFKINYTSVCPVTTPPTNKPSIVTVATPSILPSTPPTTSPTTLPPTAPPATLPRCLPALPARLQGVFTCHYFLGLSYFGPKNLPTGPITEPTRCVWTGLVGNGRLRVRFQYFDIPRSDECSKNSVAIHDGFGTSAPLIEKMCGEKCEEHVVEGSTIFLTIVMEITSPGDFRGFYAEMENY